LKNISSVVVEYLVDADRLGLALDHHIERTFPNTAEDVARFEEGVACYRAGDWNRAIARFKAAVEANPGDKPAQVYIKRCRKLKADPPRNWTGVWVMTTK